MRKFCPAIQFPGFIWEIHRASPRPSPSTLKITAILTVQSKSLSRMQRCPNITKDNSSQFTSQHFFLPLEALPGFHNVCHPAFGASLIHPTLLVLPQLLLTHNIHILPFQHPEAANILFHNMNYHSAFLLLQKRTVQTAKGAHRACTVLMICGSSKMTTFHRSKWFA